MTATITKIASDEFVIDRDWKDVAELQSALRERDAAALWGVGADLGRAALFGKAKRFEGRNVASFSLALTTPVPYRFRFTHGHIDEARTESFSAVPLKDVDPRTVEASQFGLRSGGVNHYLTVPYDVTGELFDKTRNASNDWPVIFVDEDSGTKIVQQGHHRTTAALLVGQLVRARVVRGHFKEGVRR